MCGLPDLLGPGAEFGAWPVDEGAGLSFGAGGLVQEVILALSCLSGWLWRFVLVCLFAVLDCREKTLVSHARLRLMLVMLLPSSGGLFVCLFFFTLDCSLSLHNVT